MQFVHGMSGAPIGPKVLAAMVGISVAILFGTCGSPPSPPPSSTKVAVTSTATASVVLPSAPSAGDCPVTKANGSPPPEDPGEPDFHFGNGRLASEFWPNGVVVARREFIQPDGTIAVKFPWWRAVGQVVGPVEISGRRLDGSSPPLDSFVPTEGYTDSGFTPSTLIFPVVGCWEVTGTVGEDSLTFVTLVVRPEASS